METSKKWTKEGDYRFALWNGSQQIATMDIALGTSERKAKVNWGNQTFEIRRTGFWKNRIEVTSSSGQVVAELHRDKWYSSSQTLHYNNQKFQLKVRNNPLVEWVLQENNRDLISYGLNTTNGKAGITIKSVSQDTSYLFDFILWYLFLPVAMEQGADDMTFLLLVS